MDPIPVLITSIGATGAQNVIKALRKQDQYKVKIIGCDATELNPGKHLVDKFYLTPMGSHPSYKDALLKICKEEKVALLIPVMEPELEAVSLNKDAFSAYNPSVASYETVISCNDKVKCQQLVEKIEIKCPKIYSDHKNIEYPAILKQRSGTGSVGVKVINDAAEFAAEKVKENYIVQEYIKGKEYTVDCFATRDLKFIECVPRIRLTVKGGLSTKTRTIRHEALVKSCKSIITAMQLKGPSNIQFIESEKGEIYFIEVNPRFGGAYIASIQAGLNAPLFLLNEVMKQPINYSGYKELTMLRYWEEVYE